ncbi:peptidase S41 [Oscillochloris trichoides DG-6]|uniref:Peptidase S41 n=1 Tax=Oscillochloris trichoides DG-6 TaxID=765420 RepID=E1IAW6_9CHLR|nr:S41 family peptidase [Oscillochloris trichoides]EFO81612.1 peptidase S41 [Oscillochloris trichoides DG-6]
MKYLTCILLLLMLPACSLTIPGVASAPTPTPSVTLPASLPRPPRPPTPIPPQPTLAPTPTLAPLTLSERRRIFVQVWETVRDHYLYADYNGVDWQAVYDEVSAQVDASTDAEAFYRLMERMIERLDDDHSRYESPQEVAAQQAEFSGTLRYGGIGAEIRDVDEGGLISSVVPGGPADRAGIMPRDVIISVDGVDYEDSDAFGPGGPISQVRGEPGTPVRLGIRSPNQPPREVVVIREVIDLDAFNRVHARRLANSSLGLLSIPSFYVEGVDRQVRQAVEDLLQDGPLTGLIIDVRANGGGYVHLMRNTIALFHDGGIIGSTSGRSSSEEQRIPTGKQIPDLREVPIVVLVSEETISAAEMFAAGMQVLGRARIVGTPSAGNTENLYSYDFADGSRLLLAEVAFYLPDGTPVEGRGVQPDRRVDAEWWRYQPEDDPQIQAAIEELQRAE